MPVKLKWYAVEYSMGNDRQGACYFEPILAQYTIIDGFSKRSVIRKLCKGENLFDENTLMHFTGRIEGFDTKEEAKIQIQKWKEEAAT